MFRYVDTPRGDASLACDSIADDSMADAWKCTVCGFRNVATNSVCGGAGRFGCKRNKDGSGGIERSRRTKASSKRRKVCDPNPKVRLCDLLSQHQCNWATSIAIVPVPAASGHHAVELSLRGHPQSVSAGSGFNRRMAETAACERLLVWL